MNTKVKKRSMLLMLVFALILTMAFLPGCDTDDTNKDEDAEASKAKTEVPAEVQAVKDKVIGLADKYAKQLDGDWGDQQTKLIASGEKEKFADYEAMRDLLSKFRKESGAYYVYAMAPSDTEKAEAPFIITVDGSEDPDPYGEEYEWEIQFTEAYEGTPAAARSAWKNDDEGKDLCWSAFAPIHDSEGKIVGILGIDFPAPEILDFPEWNRDSPEWNGIKE